jgi:hypothetical protein
MDHDLLVEEDGRDAVVHHAGTGGGTDRLRVAVGLPGRPIESRSIPAAMTLSQLR